MLDFDAEGHLVGIDLDHASKFVNLSRLEANSLPVQTLAVPSMGSASQICCAVRLSFSSAGRDTSPAEIVIVFT